MYIIFKKYKIFDNFIRFNRYYSVLQSLKYCTNAYYEFGCRTQVEVLVFGTRHLYGSSDSGLEDAIHSCLKGCV